MKTRGAKSKHTPELEEKLLKFLRVGNYVETACKCVGLNELIATKIVSDIGPTTAIAISGAELERLREN